MTSDENQLQEDELAEDPHDVEFNPRRRKSNWSYWVRG
jgi:hypothetical protein